MTQARVLIVVQNLSVPTDRRVWQEALALRGAGYGVTVICPAGPGDPPVRVLEGILIRTYAPPAASSGLCSYVREFVVCWLKTARLVVTTLRQEGFDVLQACNPPDTYWLLGLLAKLGGRRFVFDHHDLCPEVYVSRFSRPSPVVVRVLRLLERATMRYADHVIATNESYRAVDIERGRRRPESITVVRSAPDLTRLQPTQPDAELLRRGTNLCCYLGIMGPQDNVDVVVDAAAVIVQEMGRTDIWFALLGFGDCLEQLQARVTRLGLEDVIFFTGRADDEQIVRYLSTAAVGLSPDLPTPLNDVSTMNKTLEYMAFGLPVVAFDLRETRASAGDAATYVASPDATSFAKAILELLDDPDRRAAMGQVGASRIRGELGWTTQAAAYVGVFDRLLSRSQRSGSRVRSPR